MGWMILGLEGVDKIFTITLDNARSNDTAIKYLKRKTKDWKTTILDNEFLHMSCCAHIVNLIVCEGLKDQNESVVKIRNAVRYVRSSPSRLQTFKNCVEREKIPSKSLVCLDLSTRWNSTYMMLEVVVKFQNAFEWLQEEDSQFDSYFNDDDNDENEVEDDNGRGKGSRRKNIGPPNVLD